jgi:hypothetical protein
MMMMCCRHMAPLQLQLSRLLQRITACMHVLHS